MSGKDNTEVCCFFQIIAVINLTQRHSPHVDDLYMLQTSKASAGSKTPAAFMLVSYSDSVLAFDRPERVGRRAQMCSCKYMSRTQSLSYFCTTLRCKFCFISLNRSCGAEACAHCTANTGVDQEHALWRRKDCFRSSAGKAAIFWQGQG